MKIGVSNDKLFFDIGPSINYLFARRFKHDNEVLDKIRTTNKMGFGAGFSTGMKVYSKFNKNMLFKFGIYASIFTKPIFLNAGLKLTFSYRLKRKHKSYRRQ